MADNSYGSVGTNTGGQGYDSQGYYDSQGNYISYNLPSTTPPTNTPPTDNPSFYTQATDTTNVAPYATDNSTAPIGNNWADGGAALNSSPQQDSTQQEPSQQNPPQNGPTNPLYTFTGDDGTVYLASGNTIVGTLAPAAPGAGYQVLTPSDGGNPIYVTQFGYASRDNGLQYVTTLQAYNNVNDIPNPNQGAQPQGDHAIIGQFGGGMPPINYNLANQTFPNAVDPTVTVTASPIYNGGTLPEFTVTADRIPPTPQPPTQQNQYDNLTDPLNGFYQAFMDQNWAGVPYQPWVMRWDVPARPQQQQPNQNPPPQNNANNPPARGLQRQIQRMMGDAQTRNAINSAATTAGVDRRNLMTMAIIESGGNRNVGTNRFGYTGLFQIGHPLANDLHRVNAGVTWDGVVNNVNVNALAGALYWRQNERFLGRHNIPVTTVNTYLAHQQGAGGIQQLWNLLQTNPNLLLNSNDPQYHGLLHNMGTNPPPGIRAITNPTIQDWYNLWQQRINNIYNNANQFQQQNQN